MITIIVIIMMMMTMVIEAVVVVVVTGRQTGLVHIPVSLGRCFVVRFVTV